MPLICCLSFSICSPARLRAMFHSKRLVSPHSAISSASTSLRNSWENNEDEQALGDQLYTALGLPLRGHWRTRKPKLMGHLHHSGTEFLAVDDAHDLSF